MREALGSFFILVGASFTVLAALGLVRLPDVFMRLQATTKASTLGIGSLALAVAVYFESGSITARALLVLVFVLMTAPAGAHAIARAAYRAGTPLSENTVIDELSERNRSTEG